MVCLANITLTIRQVVPQTCCKLFYSSQLAGKHVSSSMCVKVCFSLCLFLTQPLTERTNHRLFFPCLFLLSLLVPEADSGSYLIPRF